MKLIRGLAEIVLNVHDLPAAVQFYRDVFDLPVISSPDLTPPVFLRAGNGQAGVPQMIVLVPLPADAPEFEPPRTLHHLAFEVAPEDFDRVRADLEQRGFTLRTGKHPVIPSRTLYVDDPEGNEVEVICRAD